MILKRSRRRKGVAQIERERHKKLRERVERRKPIRELEHAADRASRAEEAYQKERDAHISAKSEMGELKETQAYMEGELGRINSELAALKLARQESEHLESQLSSSDASDMSDTDITSALGVISRHNAISKYLPRASRILQGASEKMAALKETARIKAEEARVCVERADVERNLMHNEIRDLNPSWRRCTRSTMRSPEI